MSAQHMMFDPAAAPSGASLITARHVNYPIQDKTGMQEVPGIPGLKIIEAFLTPKQQAFCIQRVDTARDQWRDDLSRRVQHYGWRYDYKARAITPAMRIGALPQWLTRLARKLCIETRAFDKVPDQVIVNEYIPGQGIAMHTDHPSFGPTVCTISLLDDWEMDFATRAAAKRHVLLPKGSCVLLTGEARSAWQHGIASRQTEVMGSGKRMRRRRVSLTFRTVLVAA